MNMILDLKRPMSDVQRLPLSSGDATEASLSATSVLAETDAPNEDALTPDDLEEFILHQTDLPSAISWEAHHILSGSSSRNHYLMLGGVLVLGAVIAVWQSAATSFFVALAGVMALEVRHRWSRPTRVDVDEHGIRVDGQHFAHADIVSFDIHSMPDGVSELSLQSGRWHTPHLRLPLGDQDPADVRAVVSRYLPEGRHRIPLLEHLIRRN